MVEGAAEDRVDVFRGHEILDLGQLTRRVDGQDSLRHGADLGFSELAVHGVHLAVHVGLGDHVQVDQRDPADRRTRQSFGSPRTDAADADHGDMGMLKARQRRRAVKALDAAEAALHVRSGFAHRLSTARRMT